MWGSIKKFIRKHKKTIIISVGVATLSYLGVSYFLKNSEVKLSAFLKAVKEGYVQQVVVKGDNILFRSAKDEWYSTFSKTFPHSEIIKNIRYFFDY